MSTPNTGLPYCMWRPTIVPGEAQPSCRSADLDFAHAGVKLGKAGAGGARLGRALEQRDGAGDIGAVPEVVERLGDRPRLNCGDSHGCAHAVLPRAPDSRGSRRSRCASPRRLKPSTASMMATPGASTSQGAMVMYWRPRLSRLPQLGAGGCVPSPRKDSAASTRMTIDRLRLAW